MNEKKDKGIRLSPIYFKEDWDKLNLDNNVQEDWDTAVKIFKDRIEGRYLKQIELLDKNKNKDIGGFAGFAIMALDCLLIETLEQFYKGKIRTGQGMDERAFFDFFQRSDKFKAFFSNLERATVFYSHIRCGLLHQAQTKKKSTIHIKSGEPILQWVDDKKIAEGMRIERKLFHKEVIEIYEKYVAKISDPRNLNFRRKFKRKMDFIVNQK
jgi:hypothetical protein